MNDTTAKRAWRVARPCGWLMMAATAGALLGASVTTMAQTDGTPQPAQNEAPMVPESEVGHSTRAWLELQSSNTQAAPALPMLGAEAGLAYRRYMDSFRSKIPDLYGSALNAGSGGNGAMAVSSGLGGSGGGSN